MQVSDDLDDAQDRSVQDEKTSYAEAQNASSRNVPVGVTHPWLVGKKSALRGEPVRSGGTVSSDVASDLNKVGSSSDRDEKLLMSPGVTSRSDDELPA